MCDVEAQVQQSNEIEKTFSVNLLIRTIYHSIYFVLYVVVLSWGCVLWLTINDEQQKDPILKNLKILAPFFFTNWNYITFHGAGLLTMIFVSAWGYFKVLDIELKEDLPVQVLDFLRFPFAFFTNWNVSFQTIFLGLSLIHDVLEWLDKHTGYLGAKIKYWRDVIFSGMVFPFTLFVTGMFWSVYAIDRELVFPKVYDDVVPWWFNHCVHTNVTVVLVIETLLQARRKPANKRLEVILYVTIALLYAIVYYTIYFTTGRWLYQVFGVMNWWQVCLYQLLIWAACYFFYRAQFPINRLIHGSEANGTASTDGEPNDSICDKDDKFLENEKPTDGSKSSPTKFWSIKFRNIGKNFENSRL